MKLAAPLIAIALILGGACRKPDQPVDPSLVCATPGLGSAHYDYVSGSGDSTPEEAMRKWVARASKGKDVQYTRTSVAGEYGVVFAIHKRDKTVLESADVTSQVSKFGPFKRTRWVVGGSSKCG